MDDQERARREDEATDEVGALLWRVEPDLRDGLIRAFVAIMHGAGRQEISNERQIVTLDPTTNQDGSRHISIVLTDLRPIEAITFSFRFGGE